MRTVLQTVQSYLGLFCEDKKPKSKGYGGGGGYGFPFLMRRSKASGDGDKGNQLSRKGSPSRVHSINTLINLVDSDPNLSNMSQFHSNCSSRSIAERTQSLEKRSHSMGFRDCLAKLYGRRDSVRNHVEDPFDKCTTEYYSCGKKGAHIRRLASEFSHEIDHVADDDDMHVHSSVDSDTDCDTGVSNEPCMKAYADKHHAGHKVKLSTALKVQPVAQSGEVLLRSAREDDCDYDDHDETFIPAERNSHGNDNSCGGMDEFSLISVASDDHSNDAKDKMVEFSSIFIENRACAHDAMGEETGCCSQQRLDEEENNWEAGAFALPSSSARGHRRRFPPPLNSLAMQSYCDKRGQSPGACGTGYCLRSLRRDGRFVLQEVKAPTHRYFTVSRKDGRLKLELIDPVNDSSVEEDGANDSDVYAGLTGSNHVAVNVGLDTEARKTSKAQDEDECIGPHKGTQYSSEVEVRVGLNAGSFNTSQLVGTFGVNTEVKRHRSMLLHQQLSFQAHMK